MRGGNQSFATLIIWIAFAATASTLFTSATSVLADASPGISLGVLIVLALAAVVSTMAVWGAMSDAPVSRAARAGSTAKDKRMLRGRMTRLVDDLDDDEIYELEALLLAREEEAELRQRR